MIKNIILKKYSAILVALAISITSVATLASCTQDPYTGEQKVNNTAFGAGLGALAGGAVGALTNNKKNISRENALIGAGIGALAGGAIGGYMDKQEAELRNKLRATGVSVSRVGNNIILNMPGNITFATDKYDIRPQFYEVLNSVAMVLKEYNKTYIEVTGHTDSTGSDQYNQRLSENRARSVGNYLVGQGINSGRFIIKGAGERQPIASNETASGRAQNRRVELKLIPVS